MIILDTNNAPVEAVVVAGETRIIRAATWEEFAAHQRATSRGRRPGRFVRDLGLAVLGMSAGVINLMVFF